MSDEGVDEVQLAEIEEIALSATPGPWYVRYFDDQVAMNLIAVGTRAGDAVQRFPEFDSSGVVAATLVQHPRYVDISDGKWEENARFIAESRHVVPMLVAEVRRLRARLGQLGETE
ncbi:hypothetical protein [Amycolatopsis balhimycina]|uniref:hypothetical protein n=1 Tax=Amycolatopsis balhimycina TaxID=208443 RepID=UPI001FDF9C89|nr:hypothetical protein [Amycolatopsis balhimycina]